VQLKLPVFLISLVLLSLSASSPAFAAEESASTSRLSLFNREEEVLLPDQAFKLEVIAQDKHTLQANFTVAPGHYLYRDRIKFKSNNAQIGEITFPKGDIKKLAAWINAQK
jgi:thiol:disulfide interchange protein DsbD